MRSLTSAHGRLRKARCARFVPAASPVWGFRRAHVENGDDLARKSFRCVSEKLQPGSGKDRSTSAAAHRRANLPPKEKANANNALAFSRGRRDGQKNA